MSKVSIGVRPNSYKLDNEIDRSRCLSLGVNPDFEAISIGDSKGTLCLVPLDESSLENAELIVKLWNEYHENMEEEKWMSSQTKQQ